MSFKDRFPVISYYLGKYRQILSTFFYRKNPIKWTLKTYKRKFGIRLNLDEPKAFYEKMNYWKHFRYDERQDELTDKLLVKKYLEKIGYGDWCAKCYYSTRSVKDAKKWFLANASQYKKFVIKTSHSCGDVFVYNNGKIVKKGGREISNVNKVFKMLKMGLKFNHYYSRFEQNYKNLTPMVFFEEYIDYDNQTIEYELMCNYGKIVFSNIVFDRQSKNSKEVLFDENFKYLATYYGNPTDADLERVMKPKELEAITKLIEKVCKDFPFCRVDFVQTSKKTYFCEFTFVKSGGINIYKQDDLNFKLGGLFRN